MTTTTTDRVTLLVDVFCSPHTDEDLPVQDWRHRDGRLVTAAEADTIRSAPLRDFRTALDIHGAELDMLRRQLEDGDRFTELMGPYAHSDEMPVKDILPLLPPEQRAEAKELWDRISPEVHLHRRNNGT